MLKYIYICIAATVTEMLFVAGENQFVRNVLTYMRSSLQESGKQHGTQLLECFKYSNPQQIMGSFWLKNYL